MGLRTLRADEGPLLREVRLRAIADAPLAHSVSLDAATALDDAHWASRAAAADTRQRRVWLAEVNETVVGIVGGDVIDGAVVMDALWVAPDHRGRRGHGHVAEVLVSAVREWAHEAGMHVSLWVHESNDRARRFYERVGFHATGRSRPYALDHCRADLEMVEGGV